MPRLRKLPLGMWLRGNVYYARFRSGGEEIRLRLSSDFSVACTMLADLKLGAYRREKGEISNDYSIESLGKEWLRSVEQTLEPSSVRRYRQNINNVQRLISVRLVSQLDLEVMEAFREDRLRDGVQPQTVNKDVGALRTMLNWAVERKKIGSNPVADLKPLTEDAKQARALRPEEVLRLLEASSPHWADIWYAYLTTGLRKMELASLLFSDIDWDRHELIVRPSSSKNHSERRVPIDDKLFEIISNQQSAAGSRQTRPRAGARTTTQIRQRFTRDHVFVTTSNTPLGGNIYRQFLADCGRAGIETKSVGAQGNLVEVVDLHSTRHTFATDLITNGADPKTVQTLLGHRTLDMTMQIYAKVFTHHKRAAIGKLSYGSGAAGPPEIISISR